MEWARRRQAIGNQNTQGTDERAGSKTRKEGCGKIRECVHSVYSVAVLFNYNTFKYI
jgi:hypothetical protein